MMLKNVKFNLSLLIVALVVMGLLVFACSKKESSEQSTTTPQTEQPATETPAATTTPAEAAPAETQPAAAPTTAETEAAQPAATEAASEPAPAMAAAEVKMAPIEIKLPKPMFIGTPQNLQVPRLEKPLGKARPPFLAPEGTTNLALGKPVKSSDEAPVIGELKMVTDGDNEAGDGSYVELGPFEQHVTIDLGKKSNIYAILVWHYHKQPRVYFDVVVQVADDANFTTNVATLYNNDFDNSLKKGAGSDNNYVETSEGRLIDAKGVQGRYVRLYSSGNSNDDLNHYIEVAVYGKPVSAI